MSEKDKPYDSSDPSQVKEKAGRAKAAENARVNGLRQLMATADGRRWMWWLLSECGLFRTSFTGNSTTFFNEGQRNVGLKVLADVERHFDEQYLAMKREAKGETNAA